MKPPFILLRALILAAFFGGHASAAEPVDVSPTIGQTPVTAKKGALLFSDDFTAPELAKSWRILWPGLTVADGVLNISQDKPEHSAVGLVPVGSKDLIVAFKFKLGGASSINAVCNDRDYKEGHGGHICRVSLLPRQILLADDKARLTKEIEEMKKDPSRAADVALRVAGRSQSVPMKLDPSRWYDLVMEIVGDEMHVSLDGQPVGFLKSSGLAHPMKSDFYFAVSGKDALFDDLRIWTVEPSDGSASARGTSLPAAVEKTK